MVRPMTPQPSDDSYEQLYRYCSNRILAYARLVSIRSDRGANDEIALGDELGRVTLSVIHEAIKYERRHRAH